MKTINTCKIIATNGLSHKHLVRF